MNWKEAIKPLNTTIMLFKRAIETKNKPFYMNCPNHIDSLTNVQKIHQSVDL